MSEYGYGNQGFGYNNEGYPPAGGNNQGYPPRGSYPPPGDNGQGYPPPSDNGQGYGYGGQKREDQGYGYGGQSREGYGYDNQRPDEKSGYGYGSEYPGEKGGADDEGYGTRGFGFNSNIDADNSRSVKAFFTDSDGTLNKSRMAAVSALLLGSGVAVKKTYDHFQDKEEEEQAQKTYDHFQNKDDDEEEAVAAAQQQYGAEDAGPNRFQQFFKKEDGSFDKSHVALAAALAGGLAGGLAFAGKKTYDHYRKDDEPQSDQYQYQNQPYPPQGGQYQNQPYPPQGGQYQNQPYPPQGGQYQDKPYPPQGGQYQNQPYPPQGAHPPNPYGEQPAGDNSPNAVKAFFTDSDGTLNKSRIAAVSALLLGGGVAVKKTYDHFQDKDEEEQAQEADENETNRVKAFFTDADGTLNKSRIAGVSALLLGSGFAVKKTYDHFQNKDEEEEAAAAAAQQQYGAEDTSPNRFQQFFKKEDGSFDKSHLALAAALAGGLTIGGKKAYDHYKKNDEPAGGQYQNQPYPPQGGQYQNQPYPSQG
ncbi:hypothetical protein H4R21_004794, partial [Coemansia helicoidea]